MLSLHSYMMLLMQRIRVLQSWMLLYSKPDRFPTVT